MGRDRRFHLDLDHPLRNGGFALFVAAVLVFTIIAATYQPDDPLLHPSSSSPSSKLTSFLTSNSNATFLADVSVLRTGEDFQNISSAVPASSTASDIHAVPDPAPFIQISDIETANTAVSSSVAPAECDRGAPVDCSDRGLFSVMMRAAIEGFPDIHFYRFRSPIAVPDATDACDMAWRFRPRDANRPTLYKDYRRFHLVRSDNCTLTVAKIGDYHSGVNARKRRRSKRGSGSSPSTEAVFEPKNLPVAQEVKDSVPVVGEAINDTLPVIESESTFSSGKYLVYLGGGDRCKSMNHYLWSFLCALGEAQYLNRTLVMDLNICLSSIYTGTGKDADGKDFRFYFDFERLKDSASVIDQRQFWTDWSKWEKKDKLALHFINDFKETPMSLTGVKDTLIMRKFGDVEPDNYWYRVCEGETEAVIQRPWHLLWKSRRLMEIVSAISSRLSWDFDSVHIVRGDKARNTQLWPNLARDTSPDALLATLGDKIDNGRRLYIATDEPYTSFFDPLKDKYTTYFLDDFKDLWNGTSEWYQETKELNGGVAVEFDGYMRVEVDTEVFLRGKKQLETFNDLTRDCKDGINTCPATS
ncbi:uncharacterized protein LOC121996827 [Zingiber officinale]|uniref:O-fucosyltransferase family protein n=1 Tax=Zingiber officinale TaxID=94328 RepID=A0A8J5GC27_ZINOF|nr:uncharacterized protein LOC121996827 [Zingiber officinale]KAG6500209.1 hypothetical protein ZIOFF_040051 [Zingiber officinale]